MPYSKPTGTFGPATESIGQYGGTMSTDVALAGTGAAIGGQVGGGYGAAIGSIPGILKGAFDTGDLLWQHAREPSMKWGVWMHNKVPGLTKKKLVDGEVVDAKQHGVIQVREPEPTHEMKHLTNTKQVGKMALPTADGRAVEHVPVYISRQPIQGKRKTTVSAVRKVAAPLVCTPCCKRGAAVRKVVKSNAKTTTTMKRARLHSANRRTGGYVGKEVKQYDTGVQTDSIPQNNDQTGGELMPTEGSITCPAQGTAYNQRIGNRIQPVSFMIKGQVTVAARLGTIASDVSNPVNVRIALVYDTQCNGAEASSEDVWEAVSAASNIPFAQRNPQYMTRFRILKEWTLTFNPCAFTHDGSNFNRGAQTIPFEFFTKKGLLPIKFLGPTSNVSDIADNNLMMMGLCSDGTGTTISYRCRLNYYDH